MFFEVNENGLVYMRSDLLPYRHAFTTRFGGVSTGYLTSLNLVSGHGDAPENIRENFTRVAALMGAGPDDCAVTKQVHGNVVRTVTAADRHVCLSPVPYEADGVVTATPELPLFCFTADCVPLLLADPVHRVVGAVHCGWRSSVADIVKNALDAMCALGAEPADTVAALGPAIGTCCFETDRDVPDALDAWLGGETDGLITLRPDGKYLVDLRGALARRLTRLGLRPDRIDISDECTCCLCDRYFSHRGNRGLRGGQAACIVLPGECP